MEPVTNGESRLRLAEFGLLSGETAYIVNRDRIDTGSEEIDTWGKTNGYTYNALYIRYPSKNKITEKQKAYIQKDISEFEQVLYGKNFSDKRIGYQAYIDMDNWVDYFIINEFAMNYDAGNLSTYLYKELDGKLQLAVWDFNNGFDNYLWRIHGFKGCGRMKISGTVSVKDTGNYEKLLSLMNISLRK